MKRWLGFAVVCLFAVVMTLLAVWQCWRGAYWVGAFDAVMASYFGGRVWCAVRDLREERRLCLDRHSAPVQIPDIVITLHRKDKHKN